MKNGDVQRPGAVAEDEPVTPRLSVVPLNLLHGPEAVQHVLVTVFLKRAVVRLVVGKQKVQGLRFRHRLKGRHCCGPRVRFEQRQEGFFHHPGVLADVQRREVHPKHAHLEHELADLVQVQAVELGLHTLFEAMQAMKEDVLLEREVARIEDGFLNHALKHVQLALQSFEGDEAAKLSEFLFVAAQQREFQFARHPECGVCAHVWVAV